MTGIGRWRAAIFGLFFINGLAIGGWTSRMPAVADDLGVTLGELGLMLSIGSLGAILGQFVINNVIEHFGERRTALITQLVVSITYALFGISTAILGNVTLSTITLFVFAFALSSTGIVMNLEAAAVDRTSGRTFMPMFHATWSIGALAGAGIGVLASAINLSLAVQLPATAALILVVSIVAVSLFPSIRSEEATRTATTFAERMKVWVEPRTLAIGLIVLAASFAEASANNWLALTMTDGFSWDASPAAAMLTVFTGAMIVGRFAGGRIVDRFGRVATLRAAFALVIVGILLIILVPLTPVIIAAIVLWGLGASLGYPLGISAAADDPRTAGARVSAVATVASISLLVGPSVIGLVADGIALPAALIVIAIAVAIGLVVAGAARKPERVE